MSTKTRKIKREDLKFFRLLNDELFWFRFQNICFSPYLIKKLRECRTKYVIPNPKTFNNFIEEYKYLYDDNRDNLEIKKELLNYEK